MEKKIIKLTIAVVLILAATVVFAQPGGGGGIGGGVPVGGPPPSGGTGAPIDGGAIALLVGAASYAYRQLKEKKAE